MPYAPDEPKSSLMARIGTLLGASGLASLAASMPAAARIAKEADGRLGISGVWLALAAASLVPMILAVAVLRGARAGGRDFGEEASPRGFGLAVWLLGSALVLLLFGAALRATTHHHALAGATYALLGFGVTAGVGAIVSRLVTITSRWGAPLQRAVLTALVALLAGILVIFCIKVQRTSPLTVAFVIDVAIYVVAAAIASSPLLASSRAFATVGPPIAALVFAIGIFTLRATPRVPSAVHTRAPLLGWPVDCTAQLVRKR